MPAPNIANCPDPPAGVAPTASRVNTANPDTNSIFVPALNSEVTFVDRDVLRRKTGHARKFSAPLHLLGMSAEIPAPPPAFDWDLGGKLPLPIYGNDQYGDCYYTAGLHATQVWTGNNGAEANFDVNKVIARYKQLSGGDRGLGDDQMLPELKGGVIGPKGPYAILDDLTIDPTDDVSIALAIWGFGCVIYTASLLRGWLNNMNPGAVWDAGTSPNPRAGHAMLLTGRTATGNYLDQTWGFKPPIELTKAGLKSSDPEIVVMFSPNWFNAQGMAPNGLSYTDLAGLWTRFGGQTLPPWNGPTPPGPAPLPPGPIPQPPIPNPQPTPDGLKEFIDAIFFALERKYPKLIPALEQARALIDSYLSVPANMATHVSLMAAGSAITSVIDQIFAAIEAQLTGRPLVLQILQVANYLIDQYLASQGM